MEIWHADQIRLGWSVDMIDPSSDKDPLERYLDNEGLGALLMHPNDQDPLKVYIRDDEKSTCLPLELAEQLAELLCEIRNSDSITK